MRKRSDQDISGKCRGRPGHDHLVVVMIKPKNLLAVMTRRKNQ